MKKVVIISIESVRLIPFVEDVVTKLTPCGIKHPDNVNEEKHASLKPALCAEIYTQGGFKMFYRNCYQIV